jgi:hypothetical protein
VSKPNYNSREDEFWQGVLLGSKPTHKRSRASAWALYTTALAAVFFLCSFIKD